VDKPVLFGPLPKRFLRTFDSTPRYDHGMSSQADDDSRLVACRFPRGVLHEHKHWQVPANCFVEGFSLITAHRYLPME